MDMLGTKTAVKLVTVLLEDPLRRWKAVELVRAAKMGNGAAGTALRGLVKGGFLRLESVGKTRLYAPNLRSPAFFFLKSLFDQDKLRALPRTRKAAVILFAQRARPSLRLLILFGSTAAGTATKGSDIDLAVVGADVEKQRKETEELFGERLNIHYFEPDEMGQKAKTDPLVRTILLTGVVLVGFDFARELLMSMEPQKDVERLLFLRTRVSAAERNYQQRDHKAAEGIIGNAIEQLVFYLLAERGIPYASRKDALRSVRSLPEGKVISESMKAKLPKRMELTRALIDGELQQTVLGWEGYA